MQTFSNAAATAVGLTSQVRNDMEFHPVAALFPQMPDDQYAEFCEDIRTNGLREPIFLAEGMIADGRHRYRACIDTGVEPRYRDWDGKGNLLAIVKSLNLNRRHLSESQRAMVAINYTNMERGLNPSIEGTVSQSDAARLLNVSVASVERAAKVVRDGIPGLVKKVEIGEYSVALAADVAELPKADQKKLIKHGRKAAREVLTKLRTQSLRHTAKGSRGCLYCNPAAQWSDETVSAYSQRLEQNAKQFGPSGNSYGSYFGNIAAEIEEVRRASGARENFDKILAVIDAGSTDIDSHQCAEKSDIQRATRIPWPEFNDAIATMLSLKLIEAVKQGGKTEAARGARKILFRRPARTVLPELTYEIDDDFPEQDVYLEPWQF